ncbi:NAD-dependent epimerase/dehydratase family protein [Glutamicibacter sp. X7]
MSQQRIVILGGTGAMGAATAARFARAGWRVEVTGRNAELFPEPLRELGVRFHALDRADTAGIGQLLSGGADLLVDMVCFDAQRADELCRWAVDCTSNAVISSRAVYTDAEGRHVNAEQPPEFAGPVPESQSCVAPGARDLDPFTREGYAPGKRAMELRVLESGVPVSVLRPGKVHGAWARNARTAGIVEAMQGNPPELRVSSLESVQSLTAAANVAQLLELVAAHPASRVLNAADAHPVTARAIFERIAHTVGYTGEVQEAGDGPSTLANPFASAHPFELDTSAAKELGYRPADSLSLVAEEVQWVLDSQRAGALHGRMGA